MTIRELANEAAKAGKLDAKIVVHTAKSERNLERLAFTFIPAKKPIKDILVIECLED